MYSSLLLNKTYVSSEGTQESVRGYKTRKHSRKLQSARVYMHTYRPQSDETAIDTSRESLCSSDACPTNPAGLAASIHLKSSFRLQFAHQRAPATLHLLSHGCCTTVFTHVFVTASRTCAGPFKFLRILPNDSGSISPLQPVFTLHAKLTNAFSLQVCASLSAYIGSFPTPVSVTYDACLPR